MGQAAPFETTTTDSRENPPDNALVYTHAILRDLQASAGQDPAMIASIAMSAISAAEIMLRRAGIDKDADLAIPFRDIWSPIIERAALS